MTFWSPSSPISQVANYTLAHFRLALISRIQMSALLAKGQKKGRRRKKKSLSSHLCPPCCPKLFSVRLHSVVRNRVSAAERLRRLLKIRCLLRRKTRTNSVHLLALFSFLATHAHTCRLGFILPYQQMKQSKMEKRSPLCKLTLTHHLHSRLHLHQQPERPLLRQRRQRDPGLGRRHVPRRFTRRPREPHPAP